MKSLKFLFVAIMFAICSMFVAFSATAAPCPVVTSTHVASVSDTFTGKYYVGSDKVSYKVYQGSRGGYYCNRVAKSGKEYKFYISKEKFATL